MLFVEGQAPRGIFVLCKGRVKLSTLLLRWQDPNSEDCRSREKFWD